MINGSRFKPATRKKARLRMALDGPSGSGKSYTGLRFAFAMGARVAAIDTESGSLSKYQGDAPDGVPFQFDVVELATFSPTEYTSVIEDAGRAGYDVLLIDSLSHAWVGKDGALEIKDRTGGNSFTAWKDVTPMHNRMIDAILGSPCHVIATMRSKTDYVLEEEISSNGGKRMVPRKVGMAPVQRAGMEYEFDVFGSLDLNHILKISKSRCSLVTDAVVSKPTAGFMTPIIDWLNRGVDAAPVNLPKIVSVEQLARLNDLAMQLKLPASKVRLSLERYGVKEFKDLLQSDADQIEETLCRKLQSDADQIIKESLRRKLQSDAAAIKQASESNESPVTPNP
jgi:hypothetical protein